MVRTSLLAVGITLMVASCESPRDASASDSAAAGAARSRVGTATGAVADTTQGVAAATATRTAVDTGPAAPTAYGKMVVQMMDAMETQMRVMDTASAATMKARMPRYEPMADSLISRMNEEVRRLNIATDAIWPATVDSTRQDLGRLRAMTDSDMKITMPAHLMRMRWLIQMQRTMTGKTPP